MQCYANASKKKKGGLFIEHQRTNLPREILKGLLDCEINSTYLNLCNYERNFRYFSG